MLVRVYSTCVQWQQRPCWYQFETAAGARYISEQPLSANASLF